MHRVSMYAKEMEHFSFLSIRQMCVLHEDRDRCVIGEIQSLQDFVVMAFGIDMEEVHIPYSIFSENISQRAYFDFTFDNEWR